MNKIVTMHITFMRNTYTYLTFILILQNNVLKAQDFSIANNNFIYFDISSFCPSLAADDDSNVYKLFLYGKFKNPQILAVKGLFEKPLKNKNIALGMTGFYENSFLSFDHFVPIEQSINKYFFNFIIKRRFNQHFSLGIKTGILSEKIDSKAIFGQDSATEYNTSSSYLINTLGFSNKKKNLTTSLNYNFKSLLSNDSISGKKFYHFASFFAVYKFSLRHGVIHPYLFSLCELSNVNEVVSILFPKKVGVFYERNQFFVNAEYTLLNELSFTLGKGFFHNRLKVSISCIFYDFASKNVTENNNFNISNYIFFKK